MPAKCQQWCVVKYAYDFSIMKMMFSGQTDPRISWLKAKFFSVQQEKETPTGLEQL